MIFVPFDVVVVSLYYGHRRILLKFVLSVLYYAIVTFIVASNFIHKDIEPGWI